MFKKRGSAKLILLVILLLLAVPLAIALSRQTNIFNFASTQTPTNPNPNEMPVRLMLVIYDPVMVNHGNVKLSEYYHWNNPQTLTNQLITDFNIISHGVAKYKIVDSVYQNQFLPHMGGLRYTEDEYIQVYAAKSWNKGNADWQTFLSENGIVPKINSGEVDEVWLWAPPEGGYPESIMAGNGAFWINGGPISGVNSKAFTIMDFNYERGMSEAAESYGHRTESIIRRVYGSWNVFSPNSKILHDWDAFTALDRDIPGRGGIGNAHNAFNASPGTDYNRSDTKTVQTTADDWVNFPAMTGATTAKNCTAWNCDSYQYLKWWYDHMPHTGGIKNGVLNNWWRYILDVDQFKSRFSFPSQTETDNAENNSANWRCAAVSGTCSITDDTANKKVGASSVKFTTNGAFDTTVAFPASASANWDLSQKTSFSFWANAQNANIGFQNSSPTVYLKNDAGGYYKFTPNTELMNQAIGSWTQFTIPLGGNSVWSVTSSGNPNLNDIDFLEIHNDTWGDGFSINFDNVGFASENNPDIANPTVAINEPATGANLTGVVPIKATASDDTTLFGVDLFVDGDFVETDAFYPYIFFWDSNSVSNGNHLISVQAYDGFGKTSQKANITVTTGNPTPTPTPTPTPIPDIENPIVSITSPSNGYSVRTNSTVIINAEASDNIAVQKVEIFVNTGLLCTITQLPYNCSWIVPSKPNITHKLSAKAYDPSGNIGSSSEISVRAVRPLVK